MLLLALLLSQLLQLSPELCLHTLLELDPVLCQSDLFLELVVFIDAHSVAGFKFLDLFFVLGRLLVVLESKAVELVVLGENLLFEVPFLPEELLCQQCAGDGLLRVVRLGLWFWRHLLDTCQVDQFWNIEVAAQRTAPF